MLEITNLSKKYKNSNNKALDNISFNINKGEFVALLGQNGAGKTTLINILAENVKKDAGKVIIGGYELDKEEIKTKKIIGIVTQEINFDFIFNVNEILTNQSGYFGIKNNKKYIKELLNNLGLKDKIHSNNRELSGGMKRRLLIAKALIHKPNILILDEPTAGVDIDLRHSMYDYLQNLQNMGITIILTTHYLEEAEKLCDRIIVIDQGKMIIDDSKENIMERLGNESLIEFQTEDNLDNNKLKILSGYSPQIINKSKLQLRVLKQDVGKVLRKMIETNIRFNNFKLQNKKLEDIYLSLIKN